MSKPLLVVIPHQLGRDEARRRLEGGVEQARTMLGRNKLTLADANWEGDRLTFAVGAMGQRVDGVIDVEPEQVRLEIKLPWLLHLFAEKAQKMLQKEGSLLLTKK
jgi:hypothetical protein